MGEVLSLIRAPAIAFFGGFLVVGGWIWAPQISSLLPGFSSGVSSVGSGGVLVRRQQPPRPAGDGAGRADLYFPRD